MFYHLFLLMIFNNYNVYIFAFNWPSFRFLILFIPHLLAVIAFQWFSPSSSFCSYYYSSIGFEMPSWPSSLICVSLEFTFCQNIKPVLLLLLGNGFISEYCFQLCNIGDFWGHWWVSRHKQTIINICIKSRGHTCRWHHFASSKDYSENCG